MKGPGLPLKADTEQLETFFRALFPNATKGYISLRGFRIGNAIPFKPEGYAFSDPELLFAAEGLANLAGGIPGVVFCSPSATFKNAEKATSEALANGIAIVVDIDETNPEIAREILERILGPATIVVASGGEWKDDISGEIFPKLHLYWRLSKPTETLLNNMRG